MSELPFGDDDPDEPPGRTRGRALWAFAALASAAVVIVALMVLLLGDPSGSDDHHTDHLALPTPTGQQSATGGTTSGTSTGSSAASSTRSSTRASSTASSKSPTTAPPRTSCPSKAPCVSPGDPGGVIAAVNAYRHKHGVPPARGTVSTAAQKCALAEGDPSGCPSSYSWEPVETADGSDVIDKIVARGGGSEYLGNRHATSFAVGWAFVPSGSGGGHYSCAIVGLS